MKDLVCTRYIFREGLRFELCNRGWQNINATRFYLKGTLSFSWSIDINYNLQFSEEKTPKIMSHSHINRSSITAFHWTTLNIIHQIHLRNRTTDLVYKTLHEINHFDFQVKKNTQKKDVCLQNKLIRHQRIHPYVAMLSAALSHHP